MEAGQVSFDLMVSNACFQWLRNPQQTLRNLRRLLRPGGRLAFATFGPDTFQELHQSFDEVYRASGKAPQRHGLSFQSATQWQILWSKPDSNPLKLNDQFQTETYVSVRDFLHAVKAVGANTSEAAPRGLGSRRLFSDMYKIYENKFSVSGGIAATYDIVRIQASV